MLLSRDEIDLRFLKNFSSRSRLRSSLSMPVAMAAALDEYKQGLKTISIVAMQMHWSAVCYLLNAQLPPDLQITAVRWK